jgi:multidrug transporter EmrE-like cation transporter
LKSISIFVIYATLGSIGLTLMKKGLSTSEFSLRLIKSPTLIAGFGLYGLSFLLWMKILKESDLTYAFPIASAALFVGISLFSIYLLHENVSCTRMIGMLLIIAGILFVSRG